MSINNLRLSERIEARVLETGQKFVLQHQNNPHKPPTVRSMAKQEGVSKSTTHKDLTERLKQYNYVLYEQVNEILQMNKEERSIRGGESTKRKYLAIHQSSKHI